MTMKANSLRGAAVLLTVASIFTGAGCASRRNNTGAAIGGASGAVVGGVIGSKSGSWGKGALIGAGAGALLGYVIANETDPKNDRYEAPPPPPPRERPVTQADPSESRKAEANRQFLVAMAAKDMATTEYHLRESIAMHPTPQAHNNLGLVYLDQGDRNRARENFRAALSLDPKYEPALQNLEKLGATSVSR